MSLIRKGKIMKKIPKLLLVIAISTTNILASTFLSISYGQSLNDDITLSYQEDEIIFDNSWSV